MQNVTTEAGAAMRLRWLEAAVRRLGEGGVEAVKIMPLAKELGQTRTGFYWYFKDRGDLLKAMLELWEARTTQPLITRSVAEANSICDAVFNVMDCWIQPHVFDARMDHAVRRWALQDPMPRPLLDRSDKLRQAALAGVFERFGYSDAESETRASMFLLAMSGHVTGPRMLQRPEGVAPLAEVLCGMKPTPSELRRFLTRNTPEA